MSVLTGALIDARQFPPGSALHQLYDSASFRAFLCAVLGVPALFP